MSVRQRPGLSSSTPLGARSVPLFRERRVRSLPKLVPNKLAVARRGRCRARRVASSASPRRRRKLVHRGCRLSSLRAASARARARQRCVFRNVACRRASFQRSVVWRNSSRCRIASFRSVKRRRPRHWRLLTTLPYPWHTRSSFPVVFHGARSYPSERLPSRPIFDRQAKVLTFLESACSNADAMRSISRGETPSPAASSLQPATARLTSTVIDFASFCFSP